MDLPTDGDSKLDSALASIPGALTGIAAGAAILAYLGQPYVPFLPGWAIGAALWTALCASAIYWALGKGHRPVLFGQTLLGLGGLIALALAFGVAGDERKTNDRRCLAIQRDMLSAMPLREDGPDLFQALGCHPQGSGSVYAPFQGDEIEKAVEEGARRAKLPYRNPT
jgi:hypothetical protein